jgi:hypothetical protein
MAQNSNALTNPAPQRPAEGYSKEVYSGEDPTIPATGIRSQQGSANIQASLFLEILAELRSINANIAALREPYGVSTDLLK